MNDKYEFTDETHEESGGLILRRIRALKDFGDVRKGDLGGCIQKEANLSSTGFCWVYGNARVFENAVVSQNAKVLDNAIVRGEASVRNRAVVCDRAYVNDRACVRDEAQLCHRARMHGNSTIMCDVKVYGDVCLRGTAEVRGNAKLYAQSQLIVMSLEYPVTMWPGAINIGCQYHLAEDWWNFDDDMIYDMDGDDALDWWKTWKPALRAAYKTLEKFDAEEIRVD